MSRRSFDYNRLFTLFFILLCIHSLAQADDTLTRFGRVIVSYVDFESGRAEKRLVLAIDSGEMLLLQFKEEPPEFLESGLYVQVEGTWRYGIAETPVFEVSHITPLALDSAQPQSDAPVGRSVIVFRVNFSDAQVDCSKSEIEAHMWTSPQNVNGFFQETSFGYLAFPQDSNLDGQSDIVDVTIDAKVADACNEYAWGFAAERIASDAGVNLAAFQHRVYVLPSVTKCNWLGYAALGCPFGYCQAFTRACERVDVIPHELGHNLGMEHASMDLNNDGLVDAEYGDRSCMMGLSLGSWRHYNATHLFYGYWLLDERVQNVTQNGIYEVFSSDINIDALTPVPPLARQILRVPQSTSPNIYFDLSFRTNSGAYSSGLLETYANHLSIYRSTSRNSKSLLIATLAVGESYREPAGRRFTLLSISEKSAQVEVLMSPDVPTPTPTVTPTVTPRWPHLPRRIRKRRVVLPRPVEITIVPSEVGR